MMTIRYDTETKQLDSQPGFTSTIEDFGGSAGIEYVDSSFFNWHFIESFKFFADYLRDKGYEFKKNLFGCPYDWRFGMAGFYKIKLFDQIKELVEQAYSINGNTKVTLLGYSLGGYVSQHFLSNYSTPDWKQKYINRVVFLAPAFGGSGDTLVPAYTHKFPLVNFLSSDTIDNCLETMPVLHALFPNHVVWGDTPLVYDSNGNVVATAATWGQFLIDQGRLAGEAVTIFQQNHWFNAHELKAPGVPVVFIYNSAIQTDLAIHFGKGYDEDPTSVETVAGDGTVPVQGITWAIEHWADQGFPIVAHDMNNNDEDWDHSGLSKLGEVAELIYQAAIEDLDNGVTYVECPYYEKVDGKWVEREDIRKGERVHVEDVSAFVSQLNSKYSQRKGSRQLRKGETRN